MYEKLKKQQELLKLYFQTVTALWSEFFVDYKNCFFFYFRVSNIEKRLNFSIVNNASRLTFQFLFGYHSRGLTSNKTTKKIHLNAYFYYDLYTKVTSSWQCVTDSLFWRITREFIFAIHRKNFKSKSLFSKKSDNKLYYMQYHFANFLCISYNFLHKNYCFKHFENCKNLRYIWFLPHLLRVLLSYLNEACINQTSHILCKVEFAAPVEKLRNKLSPIKAWKNFHCLFIMQLY